VTGSLPPPLTLSTSGIISGTPNTVGTFPFSVTATDSNGLVSPAQPLTIVITPSTALAITTNSPLPNATFNVPYSTTLQATGGVPPYSWAEIAGFLPAFLSFNKTTGQITGTPTACNSYTVGYQVTDQQNTKASKPLTLTITGCSGGPTITTTSLSNALQNQGYSQTVSATGGTTPYTWSVLSGTLPHNLSLNASSGVISGTPDTPGESDFVIQVKDANNATANQPLSITVNQNLQITTQSLPTALLNQPYGATVTAVGGVLPYTWCIQETDMSCDTGVGVLPTGVTMSTAGVFSGTPTVLGNFNLTVKVTDSASNVQTAPLLIVVSTQQQNSVTINGNTVITGTVVIK
jgi:hypothetical protein